MVGIVILNYNTADDVVSCVKAVKEQTKCDYHIFVIDNASTDGSVEQLKQNFQNDDKVTLRFSSENRGFSAGNNIGIQAALDMQMPYVCILNADALLENDAISMMRESLRKNPDIGVAAPSLREPDAEGEAQYARNKLTLMNYISEKSFMKHVRPFCEKYPRYQKVKEEFEEEYKFDGMCYGCCYLARADFFAASRLMDDRVFLFNEEDIVAYKLEKLGLRTMIVPQAKVFHNHHKSIAKEPAAKVIMHLWLSPLITLRCYEGAHRFALGICALALWLKWGIHAVRKASFRELYVPFVKSTVAALRLPAGCGLAGIGSKNCND